MFYEILAFYLNIIGIAIFMGLAWLTKYKTHKDRLGLSHETGPHCRKESDFMTYCLEDMHIFCNRFTIMMLSVAAIYFQGD